MDNKTTIKKLKEEIRKFCELRDWDQYHNAKELAIGIVTEASELLEHFRFKSESQVDAMFQNISKRQDLTEERERQGDVSFEGKDKGTFRLSYFNKWRR